MENYYQVLGVAPTASAEEIKTRYRFLAKAYHPDRFSDADSKAQAENEMKRLNEAYAVLSNPEKRRAYDTIIDSGNRASSAPDPDEEEEVNYRQAAEMLAYFEQIEQRWEHLLDAVTDFGPVDKARIQLLQLIHQLVPKVFPEITQAENWNGTKKIDDMVLTMVARNIMLGSEYEQRGKPRHLNPIDLQIMTTLPVQQPLYNLFEAGRLLGRLSESEIHEKGDTIARYLFILCEISQQMGRDLSQQQARASQRASTNPRPARESTPPPPSQPKAGTAGRSPVGTCQSCWRQAPTQKVTFHRILGVIIYWQRRTIEGNLCADCIEKYFWEMTGFTLLLGWWSPPSLIATPFILLLNLIRYLGARDLRQTSDRLHTIATGWKTLVFFIVLGVVLVLVIPKGGNAATSFAPSPQRNPASVYSSPPTAKPSSTRMPTPTMRLLLRPTATEPDCSLWSEVRAADEGKRMCVYGNVKKAYWGGETFYLSFSDDPNAFRFIVLNGYYFEDVQGGCAMAEGVIKVYGKMPYIEVGEELLKCE